VTVPVAVTLGGGEAAEISTTDGTNVVLHSSVSSPPGSTLFLGIARIASPYRVKVRSCRKVPDEGALPFRIEGRFVDLTRVDRAAIAARCE
jgi:hypothetical protein